MTVTMDHGSLSTARHILKALTHPDPSTRLRAALEAGKDPQVGFLRPQIERCAVEDDFFVRETLTGHSPVSPFHCGARVARRIESPRNQARSQALHTLSKLTVPEAWPLVFPSLVSDADDEVARGLARRGRHRSSGR